MKYDVVIIGGGLGGLQCAYILAKKGMSVCLVEKERKLGGCLQMFSRRGVDFDTGFHYVGGLGDGEPLNRIFSYFNLMSLPWVRLDVDAFDEVIIDNEHYFFANGFEQYANVLAERFPHQREALKKYVTLLEKVNRNIVHSFDRRNASETYNDSLFALSAYDYLNEIFSDKRLLQVVSGASLKMELKPDTLPLYIFAQINSSFIQSAWRLRGGGDLIGDSFKTQLVAMGVEIVTNKRVTSLTEDNGAITSAVLDDGEEVEGTYFISDIHPSATMDLLVNSKSVRRVYINRIKQLPNTFGMFTVNCNIKSGALKYFNRNIYTYDGIDVWQLYNRVPGDKVRSALISFLPPVNQTEYVSGIDILTPVSLVEFQHCAGGSPMRRSVEYETLKSDLERQVIELADGAVPGLADAINMTYTSTPLTYNYYTATEGGSAYGVRKEYNNLMYTLLTPRTPAKNLFLTGQNLNLHGLLGVSMTSFMTCSELIGPVNPFE